MKTPSSLKIAKNFLGKGVEIIIDRPLEGNCIAIIHRTNDNDDKLVIVPNGVKISDKEIEKATYFQEKWFKHKILH